jgi:hypothetical protein
MMFLFCALKKNKGQALVEAAITAPLIVFFLLTVIWFCGVMLTWQQITGAARYGTDMIAYTPYTKQEIEKGIKDYLCHGNEIGRVLDRDKLEVKIEIYDAAEIDFTLSFENIIDKNPLNIIKTLESFWNDFIAPKKSYVEITYNYKVPRILQFYQEEIKIKARSEVLAGSGSPGSPLTESIRDRRK